MDQEMPKSLIGKRGRAILAIVLILIVYLLLARGAYSVFTSQIPSGNDFYPRWRGTRAFIMEGRNPYSEKVTLEIQEGMYGRPAREDEDQVAFAYPFYVSLLVLPFSFFSYPQAQALWMSALVLFTIVTVTIILRTFNWKPSRGGLLALSLWCLFFYPTVRSILLGQFSLLVLVLVALALWATERGWTFLAGCSLALSTIKPQMVFLVIPFLLLSGLGQQKYRILGGFLVAMAVLLVLSSFLLPTWIPSFITALSRYQAYTSIYREGRSPLGVLVHCLFPSQLSSWTTLLITLALGGYLIYEWIKTLKGNGDTLQALFLTIIVTLLVPVQTGTTNQVLLLLPFVFWLSKWRKRRWLAPSLSLILLVGPWALFLLTYPLGNGEHPIMVVPLPLAALAMLWRRKKETDGGSRIAMGQAFSPDEKMG
jgi:hypothetical protein